MNIATLRQALLWCAIINYGVLLLWVVLILLARPWWLRINERWFHVSAEKLDAMQYLGIMLYKLGILLFNLVPFVALLIVG